MFPHSSLLHFLQNSFIFRRFQIQQIHSAVFSHHNTVRIQIPVSPASSAPVKLICADSDLTEPFKKSLLFQPAVFPQIIDQKIPFFTVHTLSALRSVFNKFQDFIYFFHILLSSAAAICPDGCSRIIIRHSFPDSCENHQKLMLIKDFNQTD